MDNTPLVPPQRREISLRERAVAAAYGTGLGAFLGAVAWAITGELHWFYLIPICALVGIWLHTYKPDVLWGQRVR